MDAIPPPTTIKYPSRWAKERASAAADSTATAYAPIVIGPASISTPATLLDTPEYPPNFLDISLEEPTPVPYYEPSGFPSAEASSDPKSFPPDLPPDQPL